MLLERRGVWSAPALQRVLGAAGGSEPARVPGADSQGSRAAVAVVAFIVGVVFSLGASALVVTMLERLGARSGRHVERP